jgi:hypothetical protein
MAALTYTLTDSVGVTDVREAAQTQATEVLTENVSILDYVSWSKSTVGGQVLNYTVFDTLDVADTREAFQMSSSELFVDTVGITDTISVSLTRNTIVVVTDTATIEDSIITPVKILNYNLTDTAGIVDSNTSSLLGVLLSRTLTDNLSLLDSSDRTTGLLYNLVDNISIIDSVTRIVYVLDVRIIQRKVSGVWVAYIMEMKVGNSWVRMYPHNGPWENLKPR